MVSCHVLSATLSYFQALPSILNLQIFLHDSWSLDSQCELKKLAISSLLFIRTGHSIEVHVPWQDVLSLCKV